MIAESRGLSPEMLAVPEQIHSTDITCIDTPGSFMGGIGQNYFPAKFRDESVWNALKKTISESSNYARAEFSKTGKL